MVSSLSRLSFSLGPFIGPALRPSSARRAGRGMPAGQARPAGQRADARGQDGLGAARGDAHAVNDAVHGVAAAGEQPRGVGDGDAARRRIGANQCHEESVVMHHQAYMHDRARTNQALFCMSVCAILCTWRLRLDRARESAVPCAMPWRRRAWARGASRRRRGFGPGRCVGVLDPTRRQAPSVDRAAEICAALGLALSIGPAGEGSETSGASTGDAGGEAAAAGVRLLREPPAAGLSGATHAFPSVPLGGLEGAVRDLVRLVAEAGGDPIPAGLGPAACGGLCRRRRAAGRRGERGRRAARRALGEDPRRSRPRRARARSISTRRGSRGRSGSAATGSTVAVSTRRGAW